MKFVKVTSIKPVGKAHVYDISMKDNEDPSFVANDFVVHNSFAAAESAYSTFLETTEGYRSQLTGHIFDRRLFPLLAISNGLVKDVKEHKTLNRDLNTLLANRHNLRVPTLHWHKELNAKLEDNVMDMLEKVKEVTGANIPVKTWLAAAGVDKETLIKDAKDDEELKKALGIGQGGGEDGGEEDYDPGEASVHPYTLASKSLRAGHRNRVPLLSRIQGDGELFERTVTGKKKLVVNQEAKLKDIHARIAKIAAKVQADPNYRAELRKRNADKLGQTTLNL